MPIVERAQTTDIPELVKLLSILFEQEVEFIPDTDAQQRGLSQIIQNPSLGAILVLREGVAIQGMVNLLFTISTALGDRVALLEDMVISPGIRRKGVGSLLLEQALAFAHSEGCKRITLLTDRDNFPAHRFYEKHGFRASTMMPLRISLE